MRVQDGFLRRFSPNWNDFRSFQTLREDFAEFKRLRHDLTSEELGCDFPALSLAVVRVLPTLEPIYRFRGLGV